MKIWKIAGLAAVAAAAVALVMKRQGEQAVSMHEHDWEGGCVSPDGRRYRSLTQLMHHTREMLAMLDAIVAIYILRAIDPAFREQIMIVTAQSNNCCT